MCLLEYIISVVPGCQWVFLGLTADTLRRTGRVGSSHGLCSVAFCWPHPPTSQSHLDVFSAASTLLFMALLLLGSTTPRVPYWGSGQLHRSMHLHLLLQQSSTSSWYADLLQTVACSRSSYTAVVALIWSFWPFVKSKSNICSPFRSLPTPEGNFCLFQC